MICIHFGFNPRRFAMSISGIPSYFRDIRIYKRASSSLPTFDLKIRELLPILYDRGEAAGVARGHYFHQDLWAAKKIFQRRPPDHYDIGSRIDGFIAHVLTFMPITVIDIRSLSSEIDGLKFIEDDATELTSFANNSIDSLSCLHAAEHFGLGRYGDQIDPSGCFKLMKSLQRVLRPRGRLYFSVPIGRERVEFNAHRVFAIPTVVNSFAELSLLSFSFIDDEGQLHKDSNWTEMQGGECCGLFEFTKSADGSDEYPLLSDDGLLT